MLVAFLGSLLEELWNYEPLLWEMHWLLKQGGTNTRNVMPGTQLYPRPSMQSSSLISGSGRSYSWWSACWRIGTGPCCLWRLYLTPSECKVALLPSWASGESKSTIRSPAAKRWVDREAQIASIFLSTTEGVKRSIRKRQHRVNILYISSTSCQLENKSL